AFNNQFNAGSGVVTLGTANPVGTAVNQVELKPNGAGPGFDSFRAVWSASGAVDPGASSAVYGFTSDASPSNALFSAQGATSVNAPTIGTVTGRQGGGPGGDQGGTTSDSPEPTTLVLSCLGLTCLGASAWRKRRNGQCAATVS